MTEKDNFLMCARGETPEWVPRYSFRADDYSPVPEASVQIQPSAPASTRTETGVTNIWGVELVGTASTGGCPSMPKPGKIILPDITKWRDVIKKPDISGIDWEKMAKDDLDKAKIDRTQTAIRMGGGGYFISLMNFMGFADGLVAMHEEPDEVYALFDYMSEYYTEVTKKSVYYYKPDILGIADDVATALQMFISPEMYRRLVKPFHARIAQIGLDAGLIVDMHCCGKCEALIDDWREIGVSLWNPAQISNDLKSIKEKYGNSLVICGGWDSQGPASYPDATEEVIRQSVRDCIDEYAEGGGFMFVGSAYAAVGDETAEDKKRWITEEYMAHREKPYK